MVFDPEKAGISFIKIFAVQLVVLGTVIFAMFNF